VEPPAASRSLREGVDNRFARSDKFFQPSQLVIGQGHPSNKDDGEVRTIEGFYPGDIISGGAFEVGAMEVVVCFEQLFKRMQAVRRKVFIFAGDQNDVRRS